MGSLLAGPQMLDAKADEAARRRLLFYGVLPAIILAIALSFIG